MSSSSALPVFRPAKPVLSLAPGFHFHPTDDELVLYYLRPRLADANHRLPLPIFVNERILNYHPDTLIEKYRQYGDERWFFFTAREPKHLGGTRPNRTTPDNGHWNATGSVRPIRSAGKVLVGCRRTLVFYEASRSRKKKNQQAGLLPPPPPAEEEEEEGDGGQAAAKAKDGVKTEWTMYEYESLASEAEFEAIRAGNANKMDALVLCTIQKKKHHQEEGGETKKKSTKRKTKEEVLELEAVPAAAGDVEQGSRAGTTDEGQDEDHDQRAFMEAAAAAADAPAELGNFNIDPNQNMPYYCLLNSLSHLPTPPAGGDNQTVMHQQNYYFINHSSMNMNNSQSSHVQETRPQEFLPYSNTKMAAIHGGGNTMDHNHMLQNRFVNMTPSQAPLIPGTYPIGSPSRRSKPDAWEPSAELPGDKPNRPQKSADAWWSSHRQKELNSPYITNSLSSSLVSAPQQGTVMAFATREYNHAVMRQQNYFNHSTNMRNSEFQHVQATLPHPQEEFLPYSSTNMLQNRIVNMTPAAAEAHTFNGGCGPGLSNSIYGGHGGSDYGHLSTIMDHPEPSRFSFPTQQSQGLLLSNQVSLNHHQNPAASVVGYDQRNGVGLPPTIV